MASHVLCVLINPVEGREDEFNHWYDQVHVPDTIAIEGIVSAQRFRLSGTNPPQASPQRYLSLYDVETDDVGKVLEAIQAAVASGAMDMSESVDSSNAFAKFFTPITERVTADSAGQS